MLNIVYISFNSVKEPLVKSQVLSYLTGLNKLGYSFILLTAENNLSEDSIARINQKMQALGITWHPIIKGKLGVIGQIIAAVKRVKYLIKHQKIDLVHARSYFSGIVALMLHKQIALSYIYDIRGFWVDEKVYKNRLKEGSLVYKVLKYLDQKIYKHAAAIVSLTRKAANIINRLDYWDTSTKPFIQVIPTCVNENNFKPQLKKEINFVYLGSVGQGYMGDVIFKTFSLILKNFDGVKITLISRSSKNLIDSLSLKYDVDLTKIEVLSLEHHQVAGVLGQCSIGLSFIQNHMSKKASCATKIGEYLACGMPVLCNSGIGDMDVVLNKNVAVFCDVFTNEKLLAAINQVIELSHDDDCIKNCRSLAKNYFSLKKGINNYDKMYLQLLNSK